MDGMITRTLFLIATAYFPVEGKRMLGNFLQTITNSENDKQTAEAAEAAGGEGQRGRGAMDERQGFG